jgi:hypothetical protein
MSVSSEFQRTLGSCVEVLRECDGPGAARWVAELVAASRDGVADLSGGAARALEVLESTAGAPDFVSELRVAEFDLRREHLTAICRVILGH